MPGSKKQQEPVSDAEIIADSGQDPNAFALIFDRHYDAISSYLGTL